MCAFIFLTCLTAEAQKKMTLLEEANEFFYADQYKKALRVLDKLIKKEPENHEIYILRSLIYRETNKPVEREIAYKKAIEVGPLVPEVYYRYGGFLRGNKRLPEALSIYEQGVARIPDDAEMHYQLGYLHSRMNNYSDALVSFNQAISLDSTNSYYYYFRGSAHKYLKNHEASLKDYTRTIELEVKPNVLSYDARASARFEVEDYQGALEDYELAAKMRKHPKTDLAAYRSYVLTHNRLMQDKWMKAGSYAKAIISARKGLEWAVTPQQISWLKYSIKEAEEMMELRRVRGASKIISQRQGFV